MSTLGVDRMDKTKLSTFPLGFAAPLGPKVSKKTFSTAFLISTGLAHRMSAIDLTPEMVAPRFAQLVIEAFELRYDLTCSSI